MRVQMLCVMTLAALSASACRQRMAATESAAPEMSAEAAAAPAMAEAPAMMAEAAPAAYRVEFTPLWTKAGFPHEYPDTSLIHRPHFSGLIGTAHNAGYNLFASGQAPTPGLERLSETGKHDPLDAEINAAIAAGTALALTESGPLKDFSQVAMAEVKVDAAHPMVSLVAMIAPSPDWFAGVADVELMENGAWVASKTVDAFAWDSGGDTGATYLADDQDANPKQPTMMSAGAHFMKDGAAMPVGRITFTRM